MNDRLWIMVDIETSGPVIGRHSMTELGAVVGSQATGVTDRFEVLVRPISEEVKTSKASFGRAIASPGSAGARNTPEGSAESIERGVAPADAMRRFAEWARPYLARRASFIARPAAFDWPWIVWYAWTYLGDNPFGFKAVCASSWFDGLGRKFDVQLPHVAVEDAEIQLRHFLAGFRR